MYTIGGTSKKKLYMNETEGVVGIGKSREKKKSDKRTSGDCKTKLDIPLQHTLTRFA